MKVARVVGPLAACVLALVPGVGRAAEPSKQSCIDASTAGQTHRDAGRLKAAREQFVECAREECPGVLRGYCAEWLADVEKRLPSVVVRAQDAAGRDVADVKVSADGAQLVGRLDGHALPIDPGEHVLVFERAGLTVRERVIVLEGEKSRVIVARFPADAPPDGAAVEGPGGSVEGSSRRPIPLGAWILGGVGAAGVLGFAVLGLTAKSDLDGLRATCAPACSTSARDSVQTKALLADVSLGVGLAAFAAAAVVILTRPSPAARAQAVRPLALELRPHVAPGRDGAAGAEIGVLGRF